MICRRFNLTLIIAVALLAGAAVLDRWHGTLPTTLYQNPYTDIAPILQGIYDADHDASTDAQIDPLRALIVPHHLTAATTIARGVKQLQSQSIKKIVLLSPDHFFRCPTLLCTVNSDYEIFFGRVLADPSTVKTLEASPLVSNAPDLFKTEHGIYAVLPFINYYAPTVSVTPLVISQTWEWKSHQQELLDLIGSVVDDQTVLVLSSDFSHYLSLDQATTMDALTQSAIASVDLDTIANLHNADQSDCPNGLWLLAALAIKRGFDHPSFIAHTNSATILSDLAATSTTSHFAIAWR